MENTKKFIGNGKKNAQYDITNANVSIVQLCSHLKEAGLNEEAKTIYNTFKKIGESGKFTAINAFKPEGKDLTYVTLKLSVSSMRQPDNYGNTHSISLNEFVPQTQNNTQNTQAAPEQGGDDLPF